jgi:hypothetical protein
LCESGIYTQWISETLYLNNDAIRLGLINGPNSEDYGFKILELKHFHGLNFLWCSGIILSIISFCAEKMFNQRKFKKKVELNGISFDNNYIYLNNHNKNEKFGKIVETSIKEEGLNYNFQTKQLNSNLRRNYWSKRYYSSFPK